MKKQMSIALISLLVPFMYSCGSDTEKKLSEYENTISEVIDIRAKIIMLRDYASPERDTVADKAALNILYDELATILESSKDSLSISISQKLVDNKAVVFQEYSQKSNVIVGYGTITSIADGIDVVNVKTWSSVESSRTETGVLKNGDKVEVLASNGEYYLVYSKAKQIRGYTMKGFVKNLKKK